MTKHERAIEAAKSAYASHYHSGGMEAAIAAYLAVMRDTGEGEVRVRVCVAINSTHGAAWQGGNATTDEWQRDAAGSLLLVDPEWVQFRWIEATVPGWRPPVEETVEGEVVEVEAMPRNKER